MVRSRLCLIMVLILAAPTLSWGFERERQCVPIATVITANGTVSLQRADSGRVLWVGRDGEEVCAGDKVSVDAHGSAVVRTHRGDLMVQDVNSAIRYAELDELEIIEGSGYLSIQQRRPFSEMKIEVGTVELEVREGEMLIRSGFEHQGIALLSGELKLESRMGGIELYQQGIFSEYESHLQGAAPSQGADKYPRNQHYVGYRHQLNLLPGDSINISGHRGVMGRIERVLQQQIERLQSLLP